MTSEFVNVLPQFIRPSHLFHAHLGVQTRDGAFSWMRSPRAPPFPILPSLRLSHTHSHIVTQEVVVWLSSMAQVSENRSKLRDAVMHDDIIREKGRLLRIRECGMRDVGNTKRA